MNHNGLRGKGEEVKKKNEKCLGRARVRARESGDF